jgi:alpha-L-arabinofuranosidase
MLAVRIPRNWTLANFCRAVSKLLVSLRMLFLCLLAEQVLIAMLAYSTDIYTVTVHSMDYIAMATTTRNGASTTNHGTDGTETRSSVMATTAGGIWYSDGGEVGLWSQAS